MRQPKEETGSVLSIFSIIVSMTGVALGNGMMLAYVPFLLARNEAPSWIAGATLTAIAFGGFVGCAVAGLLIRRVGHARLLPCSFAVVILSALLIGFGVNPLLWVFARGLYGAAANTNFIIAQSWLNHASSNAWRGKAMSVFYMTYVIGIGTGAWIFGQIPADGNMAPMLAVLFTTLGIIPISLSRLPVPPTPAKVSVDVAMAWRSSPVAFVGVLASGGLSMVVQGFTPIYAAENSVSQQDVALLMFCMQFGLIFIQYPMGVMSDRIDRRYVLIFVCALITVTGVASLFVSFSSLLLLMLVFTIWAGAVETVYSIANAHGNDRTDPKDFVPLASTQLLAWSISATLAPFAVTLLTPAFGPKTFIYVAILLAVVYAIFVALRLRERPRAPEGTRETFEMMTAQVPNAAGLTDPPSGDPARSG